MDVVALFALFATVYALMALVMSTKASELDRLVRHVPIVHAFVLSVACWLVPGNVIAVLHSTIGDPPGPLATGLVVLDAVVLLAIVGLVIQLRITAPAQGLRGMSMHES